LRGEFMLRDDSHKVDFVEKVEIRACDLRPGMYVCELDRPWLETPFLLQGFEIIDDADIEAVMRYCEHVFIDLRRTRIVKVKIADLPARRLPNKKNSAFGKKDLETSMDTCRQATYLLKTFASEIRFGQSPQLHLATAAVSECVARVMANPSAMTFMTHLRNKDEYTSQHAFSVCIYSIIMGRLIGFDTVQLENLGTCGLLHDMGKLGIPDLILNKPGKLTPEENEVMLSHTQIGRDILLSGHDIFSGTVEVAYGHPENLDGTGYPRSLKGHQISTHCRIVGVVDKYDAITTHRPYRSGQDHLSAVAILNALAKDHKIDAKLTASFISYLGVYPPGTIVELSSGELGIVINSIPRNRLRPQLLLVRDPDKNPIQSFVDMGEKPVDEKGRLYRIVAVHNPGYFGIEISHYYEPIVQTFE